MEKNEQNTIINEEVIPVEQVEVTPEVTEVTEVTDEVTPVDEPVKEEHESNHSFQKRIDRFNRRIAEKEAEIEHWKAQALSNKPREVTPVQVISDKPALENYSSIEDYTDAMTEWKFEQKLAQKHAKEVQQQTTNQYHQRLQSFIKTTPDFDEVLADVANIPAAQEIHQVILESEVGPQLAYYLASNIDEMKRINGLAPHRRLIELGKLEDKLTTKPVTQKKVSAAPAPITREKGTAPVLKNPDEMSQSEYREWRAKQLSTRRRF